MALFFENYREGVLRWLISPFLLVGRLWATAVLTARFAGVRASFARKQAKRKHGQNVTSAKCLAVILELKATKNGRPNLAVKFLFWLPNLIFIKITFLKFLLFLFTYQNMAYYKYEGNWVDRVNRWPIIKIGRTKRKGVQVSFFRFINLCKNILS